MPIIKTTLILIAATLLSACDHQARVFRAEYFVFGTLVEVSIANVSERTANQAFGQVQEMLQSMHQDWHAWQPGKLTSINQAFATGKTADADEAIIEMVQRSQQLERLTAGRFNPAVGRLIGLWGFHTSDYPVLGPPPSAQDIAALVGEHPSTQQIEITDHTMRSSNPSVQLDFGGLAKGKAVDEICHTLRLLGINDAIVNAGGDLRAFGSKSGKPWRVALRNPLSGILGSMEIHQDEAVFTSGNYERFRVGKDNERYPHILDPRTGWPARHVMSATVVADEGILADAAATALIVAGLDEWSEVASALGLDKILITDAAGKVYATPAMVARLQLDPTIEPVVITPRG